MPLSITRPELIQDVYDARYPFEGKIRDAANVIKGIFLLFLRHL